MSAPQIPGSIAGKVRERFPQRDIFGRLGLLADVNAQLAEAQKHGATVARDEDAGTVIATAPDGREMFRAIAKGAPARDPWIVIYSKAFYSPDTIRGIDYADQFGPKEPGGLPALGSKCDGPIPPQTFGVFTVTIHAKGDGRQHGTRYAKIAGPGGDVRRVPVELCGMGAGPDAWLREIRIKCIECRAVTRAGDLENEYCPECIAKAEAENEAANA